MKFPVKLRQLLTSHDLNRREVSEKIGVSPTLVSRWTTGKAKPTADQLLPLARLFDVTVDTLLDDQLDLDASGRSMPPLSDDERAVLLLVHSMGLDLALRRLSGAEPTSAPPGAAYADIRPKPDKGKKVTPKPAG